MKKQIWAGKAVRRFALGSALLALLYAALGFLALPAILKSQASQFTLDKLQRQLAIEKASFNPFTLKLSIEGIKLMEPKGGAVAASVGQVTVNLSAQSLWRLAPVVQQLRLDQPYVHLARDAANRYNIADILEYVAAQPPSPEPARFSFNNIEIEGGRIVFDDQPAHSTHTVEGLRLGVPSLSSMPSDVQVFVEPLLAANVNGAPLLLKGKARPFAEPKDIALELKLDNVDLPRYLEYLPSKPNFKLAGTRLDARITASFRQPHEKGASLVLGGEFALGKLDLQDGEGKPVLKLGKLDVALGHLDVFAGRFDLARIGIEGLDASLARDAKGQLNIERLMAPAPAPKPGEKPAGVLLTLKELALRNAALRYSDDAMRAGLDKFDLDLRGLAADSDKKTVSVAEISSNRARIELRQDKRAAPAPAPPAAGQDAPYVLRVARVALQDWSLAVDDRSHGEASLLALAPLSLTLQDVSTVPGTRMKLDLKSGVGKAGKLAASGSIGIAPLHVDLALEADKVSLLPLQPYATEHVNLRLTQALLGGRGKLQFDTAADGTLRGGYKGDASLDQMATVDKASSNDFVSWKSLALGGMDLRFEPFALNIDKVTLADFFARVIIDPTGRINAQDIRRVQGAGGKSLTDEGARAAAATPAAAPAPAEALPPIQIRALALSGGRVRFTDNFIRPNYTANLKDLGGAITGLSSAPEANANVDVKGAVNGAPLLIAGRINPLKRDLSMDIKAEVRGIELSTLSAYADKYVGYGIEKGKLSFEVAYKMENRQLHSENRLMLDQLTFGSESVNPEAKKLPVRLAVALLSDRNGLIDISVPVGGTLDDPQFSVGGIVMKIIGNAITKTVTAPFALLGAAFGGGEEMATLEFEPGHAAVLPAGEARLAALAKALVERPGLRLDVMARVDPALDAEALKRVSVERKLRALKLRDLQGRGEAAPAGGVVVDKEEYGALLARAFKDETFAKPKNALGLQATPPAAEMEKLMAANASIDNDDLLALARRRSQAAKDWLASAGKVPVERIYIVTGKVGGEGADASKPGLACCRVDFTLR
jgi:hypothetical protein